MGDKKIRLSVESDAELEETKAKVSRRKPRVEKLKAQGVENALGSTRTVSSLEGEAVILSDERLSDLTNPMRATVDPSAALQRAVAAPPPAITPTDILSLQRTVGNQGVQLMLAERRRMGISPGPIIQTKLTVNPPGDYYEKQADRVAEQVVARISASQSPKVQRQDIPEEEEIQRKPINAIQRQAEEEEEEEVMTKPASQVQRQAEEEEEEVQAKAVGSQHLSVSEDLEKQINKARLAGQPLSEEVRQPMERAFDTDFSGVRVHIGCEADALNHSLQAKAFTTGQDIFFKSGEYDPAGSSGQQLIAHELTHTVQQGASPQKKRIQVSRTDQNREEGHYVLSVVTDLRHNLKQVGNSVLQRIGWSKLLPWNWFKKGKKEGPDPRRPLPEEKLPAIRKRWNQEKPPYSAIAARVHTGGTGGETFGGKGRHASLYLRGGTDPDWDDKWIDLGVKEGKIYVNVVPMTNWPPPNESTTWQITKQGAADALAKSHFQKWLIEKGEEVRQRVQKEGKKTPESFKEKKYAYWFPTLNKHWENCSSFAEKILKAAGIERSAGFIFKIPAWLAKRKLRVKGTEKIEVPNAVMKERVTRIFTQQPDLTPKEITQRLQGEETGWIVQEKKVEKILDEWRKEATMVTPDRGDFDKCVKYLVYKYPNMTADEMLNRLKKDNFWIVEKKQIEKTMERHVGQRSALIRRFLLAWPDKDLLEIATMATKANWKSQKVTIEMVKEVWENLQDEPAKTPDPEKLELAVKQLADRHEKWDAGKIAYVLAKGKRWTVTTAQVEGVLKELVPAKETEATKTTESTESGEPTELGEPMVDLDNPPQVPF